MDRLHRYRALSAALLTGLALLAAPLLVQETPTPGLYDRPVLVLDPGMHTAPINRALAAAMLQPFSLAFNPKDGRLAIEFDGCSRY
jgi:hypothetical protein